MGSAGCGTFNYDILPAIAMLHFCSIESVTLSMSERKKSTRPEPEELSASDSLAEAETIADGEPALSAEPDAPAKNVANLMDFSHIFNLKDM